MRRLCLALLLLPAWASGASFYVDCAAGAGGDGSLATPWDAVADVNAASFSAGDSVLFKKGCTWRETLTVPSSGSAGSPITFGAYGTGSAPIITGADVVTTWSAYSAPLVFTPDAHPETTSVDGEAYQWSGDVTWAALRGAAGSAANADTSPWLPFHIEAGPSAWRALRRGILTFNTAAIGDGDAIASAVLRIYGAATTQNTLGVLATVNVFSSAPASDTAVVAGDFDSLGTTPLSDTAIAVASWNAAGWNSFTLNAAGLAAISKVGVTKLGTREATFDATNTEPAYSASTEVKVTAESAEGAHPPELVVTLSGGAGPIWSAAVTTEPNVVIFDGVRGTKVASIAACDSAREWFWAANVLYVYSAVDPDGAVVIEAGVRDTAVDAGRSNVTITGLTVEGGNTYGGLFHWTNSAALANLVVSACTIRNNYGHGINVTNAHASFKTTGVTITGNAVYENAQTGINIGDGVNTVLISDNAAYRNNWVRSDYNAGIRTNAYDGADGQAVTIERNTVYENYLGTGGTWSQGNGIHVDYNSGASPTVVRYNRVYSNEGVGIFIEATPNAQVYYNVVSGNAETGILVFRLAGGVKVYNNTVYGNLDGIALRGENAADRAMIGHLVKNNISVGNSRRQLVATYGAENDGVMGSGNVYLNNALGAQAADFVEWGAGVTKATYDAWETAYGATTSSVEADPLFVGASDFRLQSASPAINAGVGVGLTSDFLGNPVPAGSAPDIGAYETRERVKIRALGRTRGIKYYSYGP